MKNIIDNLTKSIILIKQIPTQFELENPFSNDTLKNIENKIYAYSKSDFKMSVLDDTNMEYTLLLIINTFKSYLDIFSNLKFFQYVDSNLSHLFEQFGSKGFLNTDNGLFYFDYTSEKRDIKFKKGDYISRVADRIINVSQKDNDALKCFIKDCADFIKDCDATIK